MKLAVTIIQLLCGLFLIVIVLLQTGKHNGLSGAISGNSDTYTFKAKNNTLDAKLSRWTKWVALVFVLLTFALNLID
ncbi:MAG: preprotein translocase subunit SecG [Oscillospiraceae bacterium]|nr:preprotein translocase subunit SecG [Oscillospiraceae bacterium]MCC8079812.1 preprotein translocase subunit SecG [Oscillospiraceae bacterium]MCD7792599.1 preprotein translocase subunit SecG [Oscillospiraceae bacterium]MCD8017758.1 preprotein translocase subunit SecG [Oscillospiraceae bacterium]MCD8067117.1 preprotein translocase subunit SecG [Oscillospiraceae bacterium]